MLSCVSRAETPSPRDTDILKIQEFFVPKEKVTSGEAYWLRNARFCYFECFSCCLSFLWGETVPSERDSRGVSQLTVSSSTVACSKLSPVTPFLQGSVRWWDFLGGSKNPLASAGDRRDAGSTPEVGRSPGVGNGNPLQYSCLGNPMDRGAWGHKELDTTKRRSTHWWTVAFI